MGDLAGDESAPSEQKKDAMVATSSGWPTRRTAGSFARHPRATLEVMPAYARIARNMSVAMKPGAMALASR
jgi:hypothetical protein